MCTWILEESVQRRNTRCDSLMKDRNRSFAMFYQFVNKGSEINNFCSLLTWNHAKPRTDGKRKEWADARSASTLQPFQGKPRLAFQGMDYGRYGSRSERKKEFVGELWEEGRKEDTPLYTTCAFNDGWMAAKEKRAKSDGGNHMGKKEEMDEGAHMGRIGVKFIWEEGGQRATKGS